MNLKYYLTTMGILGGIFGTNILPINAAIPVFDPQNITQQLKILSATMEQSKINDSQRALAEQNLAGLSESQMAVHNASFRTSNNNIANSIQQTAQKLETTAVKGTIEDMDEYIAFIKKINEERNNDNLEVIASYKTLREELAANQRKLQELNEQNTLVVGNKQALQLANQIAAVKVNMEAISVSIQVLVNELNAKESINKAMEQQMEIELATKAAKAEDAAVNALEEKGTEYKYSDPLDDPWSK